MVEREDRHGNWRPVGQLDLQRSKPDTLYLESMRPEQRNGPPLVDEGNELRFRSRMEETSLDRRQAAVRRIVGRTSRTRNLIGILDPRIAASPQLLPNRQPVEMLKEQYGLNDQQAEALSAVLATRPLALVQGPPGTGKTVFIAALVHAALTSGVARNVLLASQAHEAVNNAAEAVLKLFARAGEVPSILRVGNEGVVSDRLLPFHVERVEQLQKDRFRAEMRERLAVAAQGLGIPQSLTDALTHVELAIRPVTARLAALQGEESATQRITALRETVDQQIVPLGLGEMLSDDVSPEQIVPTIVGACLRAVPQDVARREDDGEAYQLLVRLAPEYLKEWTRRDGLSVQRFYRHAFVSHGDVRADRPTVPIIGSLFTMENARRLFEIASYGLRKTRHAAAAVYWVVPQAPLWGSTSIMAEAVEQFRERVIRTNEDLAVRQDVESIALTAQRSERWVKEAFTRDHGSDARVFPGGFEMLLVPGAFVAATVHAPIGQQSGLPVPLGFASFDQRVLARAGELLHVNSTAFKLGDALKRNLVASPPADEDEESATNESVAPDRR